MTTEIQPVKPAAKLWRANHDLVERNRTVEETKLIDQLVELTTKTANQKIDRNIKTGKSAKAVVSHKVLRNEYLTDVVWTYHIRRAFNLSSKLFKDRGWKCSVYENNHSVPVELILTIKLPRKLKK